MSKANNFINIEDMFQARTTSRKQERKQHVKIGREGETRADWSRLRRPCHFERGRIETHLQKLHSAKRQGRAKGKVN